MRTNRILLAVAVAATAVLAAGCGSHHPGAGARPVPTRAASRLTPEQHCQATVMVLLSQTVTAMENGYSGGIDVNQVMARYGAYSDVFQTFIQANSQVILYVDEHGPAGSLASVAGLVRADCQQYGAGTGS